MASLTHPAHHRHQSAHAHGSPPFSAIRFHPLDLAAAAAANGAPSGGQSSVASLNPSPLVYAAASHLPTISAHHQAVPSSILVHAPGPLHHHQNPFGPFAAAFAGSLLAGRPPLLANGQHFLDGTTILSATNGQSAIMLNADGSAPSMIAFGQSKEPVAAAALVDNSPPQLSVASLSSSSFGPDSDGRSCSSSSCPGGTSNSAMLATQANGEPQVHEGAPAIGQSNEEGGGRQQGKGAMIGSRKQLVRDEAYWERRRKNNDAAKRSRDSRRKKEDEVAVRAVILEQENLRLRFELERLRTEIERHRIVAFSQGMAHQQQQDGNGAKFGGDQQQLSAAAAAFLCPSTHPMALAAAAAAAAAMANAGGNGLMVVPVTRENGEMPTISTTSSASSSSSSAN